MATALPSADVLVAGDDAGSPKRGLGGAGKLGIRSPLPAIWMTEDENLRWAGLDRRAQFREQLIWDVDFSSPAVLGLLPLVGPSNHQLPSVEIHVLLLQA